MIKVEGIEIKRLAEDMSDEEFYRFCQANRDLRIERDEHKNIIVMTPIGGESGFFESKLIFALEQWNQAFRKGLVFSSSTGFLLPSDSIRSPDASWVAMQRWQSLRASDKKRFPPLTPDFVAEIRSESDELPVLHAKMEEYIEQGARLGWLLDPQEKTTYIYRADGSMEALEGWDRALSGEEVLPGFLFDLEGLRLPE